jgi:hypothetical protein
MADICGIAVDLYVKHALGVNDMVANNCCGWCMYAVSFKYSVIQLTFTSFPLPLLHPNSLS